MPEFVGWGIVFVIGAIVVAIGTRIVRGGRNDDALSLQWTQSLGIPEDVPLDVPTRLDMIERLAMLGQPWCVDALQEAAREEREPRIGDAIAAALRARGA